MTSAKDFLLELQNKGILDSIDDGQYKVDDKPFILCWRSDDNQSHICVRTIVVGPQHIRFEGPVFGVDAGYDGFIGFHKDNIPRDRFRFGFE